MSCRNEILSCANQIIKTKGINEFSIREIIDCMNFKNSTYKENTRRTHVTSRMCKNAPRHHATKFEDLERIARGTYQLKTV